MVLKITDKTKHIFHASLVSQPLVSAVRTMIAITDLEVGRICPTGLEARCVTHQIELSESS